MNVDREPITPRCSRWASFDPGKHPKRKTVNKYTVFGYLAVLLVAVFTMGMSPAAGSKDEQPAVKAAPKIMEVQMPSEAMHRGELILVNAQAAYQFSTDDLFVSVLEGMTGSYAVKDAEQKLLPQTLGAFNRMMDDFKRETPAAATVNVVSTHRTFEFQQKLLNRYAQEMGMKEASRWSAKPGHSEHHTGYALDLGIISDGQYATFDGQGVYSWITEHCSEYGFIVRYADDKKGKTGFYGEPWHFRYVGKPHASAMLKMGYCMEEYVDWLRTFSWSEEHLNCVEDGAEYEIYFVPAEQEGVTVVPVPEGAEYTISGNNVDGFIVTITVEKG